MAEEDRVLLLTIDRPAVRNALHVPALRALTAALAGAAGRGLRAAVLTGAGRQCFCAGMDLKALATGGPEVGEAVAEFSAVLDGFDRPPLIAAVTGAAIGGGFELMLRCDLAVAADDVRFALPEVGRGLVPGGGATLLPARIPIAIAMELALTGEPLDAARVHALGLVNRVVPADAVLQVALALARLIAAGAPGAAAATRRLMWTTHNEGPVRGWAETQAALRAPERRAEMEEGVAAFREKRAPNWG